MDRYKRLGSSSTGGGQILKEQSYFKGTDWDSIAKRKLKPEYLPSLEQPNFLKANDMASLSEHSKWQSSTELRINGKNENMLNELEKRWFYYDSSKSKPGDVKGSDIVKSGNIK